MYVNGKKIASIGLKYTRGCLYHGFAFNYKINFNHWSFINPCGYHDMKVIDLHSLNNEVSYDKTVNYLIKILLIYWKKWKKVLTRQIKIR